MKTKTLYSFLFILLACGEEGAETRKPATFSTVEINMIEEDERGVVTESQRVYTYGHKNEPLSMNAVYMRGSAVEVVNAVYEYDTYNRLVKITEESNVDVRDRTVVITYAGNLPAGARAQSGWQAGLPAGARGPRAWQASLITNITHHGEITIAYDYTYNSHGQISHRLMNIYFDAENIKSNREYLYASSTSVNPYRINEDGGYYTELEFDNKRSFWDFYDLTDGSYGPGFNNPLKATRRDRTGKIVQTTAYQYQYNDKGYVTNVALREIADGGTFSGSLEGGVDYAY